VLKIAVPELELCRYRYSVSTVHIILKTKVNDPGTKLKKYHLLNSFITMNEKSHWKE
jgi:hypothetical protein